MAIELRNCSDTGTYPCGPCNNPCAELYAIISQPTLQMTVSGTAPQGMAMNDSISSFSWDTINGVSTGSGTPHSCFKPGSFTATWLLYCNNSKLAIGVSDAMPPEDDFCWAGFSVYYTGIIPQNGVPFEATADPEGTTATFTISW
jgi:hypothetical protein